MLFIDNFVVRWMELVSNNYILGDSSELNSAIISGYISERRPKFLTGVSQMFQFDDLLTLKAIVTW